MGEYQEKTKVGIPGLSLYGVYLSNRGEITVFVARVLVCKRNSSYLEDATD